MISEWIFGYFKILRVLHCQTQNDMAKLPLEGRNLFRILLGWMPASLVISKRIAFFRVELCFSVLGFVLGFLFPCFFTFWHFPCFFTSLLLCLFASPRFVLFLLLSAFCFSAFPCFFSSWFSAFPCFFASLLFCFFADLLSLLFFASQAKNNPYRYDRLYK